MKKKNTYLSVLITICSVILFSCNTDGDTKEVIIEEAINPPSIILAKGNSWVVGDIASNEEIITEDGIRNWKDLDTKIRTYFKVNTSGQIKVSLKAQAVGGSSVVTIALGDQQKEVEISNTDFQTLEAGVFSVEKAGYYFLEIQGKSNTGETIADIDSFTLEGSALNEGITYVKEDFYWGRRGPSGGPMHTKAPLWVFAMTAACSPSKMSVDLLLDPGGHFLELMPLAGHTIRGVGTGGGVILVPMLMLLFDIEPAVVAGTSLTLVALNSFSGSLAYRRQGLVDRRSGLLFGAAAAFARRHA